jgi:hypothetical protein
MFIIVSWTNNEALLFDVLFAATFIAVQMREACVAIIPELRYGDFDKLLEILYGC